MDVYCTGVVHTTHCLLHQIHMVAGQNLPGIALQFALHTPGFATRCICVAKDVWSVRACVRTRARMCGIDLGTRLISLNENTELCMDERRSVPAWWARKKTGVAIERNTCFASTSTS